MVLPLETATGCCHGPSYTLHLDIATCVICHLLVAFVYFLSFGFHAHLGTRRLFPTWSTRRSELER
jgi:hypothetical protein